MSGWSHRNHGKHRNSFDETNYRYDHKLPLHFLNYLKSYIYNLKNYNLLLMYNFII